MSLSKEERDAMRKVASCPLCDANVPLVVHSMTDGTVQEVHVYTQDKHGDIDLGLVEVARVRSPTGDTTTTYLVCCADSGRLSLLEDLDAKDKQIAELRVVKPIHQTSPKVGGKPPHGDSWVEYLKIILEPILAEAICDRVIEEFDAIDAKNKRIAELEAKVVRIRSTSGEMIFMQNKRITALGKEVTRLMERNL